MENEKKEMEPVKNPVVKKGDMTGTILKFFPLTPVSFQNDSVIAFSRIAGYGMLSALSWKKNKTAGMFFAGAAAISAGVSLMAGEK